MLVSIIRYILLAAIFYNAGKKKLFPRFHTTMIKQNLVCPISNLEASQILSAAFNTLFPLLPRLLLPNIRLQPRMEGGCDVQMHRIFAASCLSMFAAGRRMFSTNINAL